MSNNNNDELTNRWCLIESDPFVFSELVSCFGVKGVEITEVYSLEEEAYHTQLKNYNFFNDIFYEDENFRDVYGLIFLFKWSKELEKTDNKIPQFNKNHIFFANQVIENTCATQALLMVLLNSSSRDKDNNSCDDNDNDCNESIIPIKVTSSSQTSSSQTSSYRFGFKLGNDLKNLRHFASDFNSNLRGVSIANSEFLRSSHNSFALTSPFQNIDLNNDEKTKDDAFHFTSILPIGDEIYELDGLREAPLRVGGENCLSKARDYKERQHIWLEESRKELQRRINAVQSEEGGAKEMRFCLLAVVPKALDVLRFTINDKSYTRKQAKVKLLSFGSDEGELNGDEEFYESSTNTLSLEDLPNDVLSLRSITEKCTLQIQRLKEKETEEEIRWKKGMMENQRRRYDYVPFILCAMRHLARRGELLPAYEIEKEEQNKKIAELFSQKNK